MTDPRTPSATYDSMTDQQKVEWEPIKDFPSYEVSNHGDIRSTRRYKIPHVMKKNLAGNGYFYVQLRRNGKSYSKKISRAVCDAFIIDTKGKLIVNHIDGNKQNDYYQNLEWCSQGDNLRHAYRTGLKHPVRGEDSPNSKLTNDKVRSLREWVRDGHGIRETARKFLVSHTTVRKILSGSKWKHVA